MKLQLTSNKNSEYVVTHGKDKNKTHYEYIEIGHPLDGPWCMVHIDMFYSEDKEIYNRLLRGETLIVDVALASVP